MKAGVVLAPRAILKLIAMVHDEATAPPEMNGMGGSVPGGVPDVVSRPLLNVLTRAPVAPKGEYLQEFVRLTASPRAC